MRKVLLFWTLFVSFVLMAQNRQLLYNFTPLPQSLMLNPGADVTYKWYAGVPFLSGVSANVNYSGFTLNDLFVKDGVDFNIKFQNVVNKVSRNDKAVLNQQLEIFSAGFKVGNWNNEGYLSFGMYQEFDFLMYMPKDVAVLALYGNKDYMGKKFNLADMNGRAELLTVYHLGYHKNLKDNLVVGLRGKIYSSGVNLKSTNNSGYIYTAPSYEKNIYKQEIKSDVTLNTSGISKYIDDYESVDALEEIKKKMFSIGDLGFGIDAGFTYYPKEEWQITGSVVDLGFVYHSKDVRTYRYKGIYVYEGINPNFQMGGSVDNPYEQFKKSIPLDTLYSKYTSWRPTKLNASAQYSFGRKISEECTCETYEKGFKNSVGAQFFLMATPRIPLMAFTAYFRKNFSDKFQMKTTYTVDQFTYKNVGLAMNSQIGKANFYLFVDHLLDYADLSKTSGLSFQLGFNVIFEDTVR